jgi:hypothetical protein
VCGESGGEWLYREVLVGSVLRLEVETGASTAESPSTAASPSAAPERHPGEPEAGPLSWRCYGDRKIGGGTSCDRRVSMGVSLAVVVSARGGRRRGRWLGQGRVNADAAAQLLHRLWRIDLCIDGPLSGPGRISWRLSVRLCLPSFFYSAAARGQIEARALKNPSLAPLSPLVPNLRQPILSVRTLNL